MSDDGPRDGPFDRLPVCPTPSRSVRCSHVETGKRAHDGRGRAPLSTVCSRGNANDPSSSRTAIGLLRASIRTSWRGVDRGGGVTGVSRFALANQAFACTGNGHVNGWFPIHHSASAGRREGRSDIASRVVRRSPARQMTVACSIFANRVNATWSRIAISGGTRDPARTPTPRRATAGHVGAVSAFICSPVRREPR
jgi:hypothetical protein